MLFDHPARIAVFASGQGSNLEALATAHERDALGGAIVAVFSDRPEALALERARRHGFETVTPPVGRFRTRLEDDAVWLEALQSRGIDVVLLAGFMRRLHAPLVTAYAGRMLNLHPSLLPSFPGLDAIGQAHRHGVRVTGCTVHLVEDDIDAGPIVAQRTVEVRPWWLYSDYRSTNPTLRIGATAGTITAGSATITAASNLTAAGVGKLDVRTTGAVKRSPPRIDPAELHARAVILLKQPMHYREVWRIVLDYPLLDEFARLRAPSRLVAHEQDTFAFAAGRAADALRLPASAPLETNDGVAAAVSSALAELDRSAPAG